MKHHGQVAWQDPVVVRLVDHHAHLLSPAAANRLGGQIGKALRAFTADDLVAVLDEDEVERAVVLSVAYMAAGSSPRDVSDENDWVAGQVRRHPDRLVGFFSVNPLTTSVDEIDRCVSSGCFGGMKLHFANSGVDLLDPGDQERTAMVLAAAADRRLPVVIHLRTSTEWGATHAEAFIDQVLPAAGGTPVQIAHLGGWGGYDAATDQALAVLARNSGRDEFDNVYFDVSAVVRGSARTRADYEPMVEHLHDIGLERILFGN